MSQYQLKKIDKKLLSYLYYNGRAPISKIAKELKLSREQVSYHLNKYLSEKIILKFFPLINYKKIGYKSQSILLLKFKSENDTQKFLEEDKQSNHSMSTGRVFAKYDIYTQLMFKDNAEKNEYISTLIENYKNELLEYNILIPEYSEFYPLKIIGNTSDSHQVFIPEKNSEYQLDEKEKRIIKALSENGREKLVNIAISLDTSAELILHKMKKLQKEGVLLGTRAYLNIELLDYHPTLLLLKIKSLTKEIKERIKAHCKMSKYIDSLSFQFNAPNCWIQIIHKSERELREVLIHLRKVLNNIEFDLQIIPIQLEENKIINTTPFL